MKNNKMSLLIIFIILLLTASVIYMFVSEANGKQQTNKVQMKANQPIEIIGSYQVDGGAWQELTKDIQFDDGAYQTIIIKGHFSRGIPAGQSLLFYIQRLYVSLKIDREEVYVFGEGSSYSSILKVPGTTFADYISPGISTDAEVELVIRGTQKNASNYCRMIIYSMQTGSHAELYKQMLVQNKYVFIFCMFILFISVMALLLAVIAYSWRVAHSSKAMALTFFSATGALALLTDLNHWYMPLIITDPTILCIFEIVILYLVPGTFLLCILSYAGKQSRLIIKAACAIMCMLTAVMLLLQCLGIVQLYEAQPFFWSVSLVLAFGCVCLFVYCAFKYNEKEAKLMILSFLPVAFFLTLDVLNYLFSFSMLTNWLGIGMSITLTSQLLQIIYMIKRGSDAAKQKLQLENELIENRIAVMISQIQPHFLYNSLAAIQRLCTKDPKLAEEAVIQFSIYLRGNMDSLTYKKNIPFEKELVHLENYLALEKKRFGDKLNIVYDISVSNFYIPALTIQPIAENAVRHGITKRDEESGTLTISTSENETDIMITVTDDGIGFDTNKTTNDVRQHIGIENVRSRLASMCGGTITVQSEPGVGTTVIIKIPKGDL